MYRRHRKMIKVKYFAIVLFVAIICISIGYAQWSTELRINGKVIGKKELEEPNPDLPSETSKSTATWSITNEWGEGTAESPKFYQVKIDIENHDGPIEQWKISFSVPKGIIPEKINNWSASSTEVENNRVYFTCHSWNGNIADGGVLGLEFQLAFEGNAEFFVKDIVINNKLIVE